MSAGVTGPLAGLRVVDLAGPSAAYATKLLADLGAEVVMVEPPGGSFLRRLPPFEGDASLWFAYFGANKRSVVLNLASAADVDRCTRLIAGADVVVDTNAPGHLERFGLSADAMRAAHPGLIWVSVTPFGRTGPHRDWVGSDLVAWAMSGCLHTTGFPGSPPVIPGGPALLACHLASLNAAAGAMLALRSRRRTGRGQMVEVSIQESCLAVSPEVGAVVFLDDLRPRVRGGNRRSAIRPWGLYPARDGWVGLVALQPAHWSALATWIVEATGNEAAGDPAFNDVLTRIGASEAVDIWTEELTTRFDKAHLFVEGQRRGIPVTPVNTAADLSNDPHLAAVGYWETVDDPTLGKLRVPGAPYRFSAGAWSTASRRELERYLRWKLALRFSLKARGPSLASSEAKTARP
jgi:crotonobetainyl-CoA:carnitine CoA-transferase CaiB-like acyl-CoA transferase